MELMSLLGVLTLSVGLSLAAARALLDASLMLMTRAVARQDARR